jgi:hypothetical protein
LMLPEIADIRRIKIEELKNRNQCHCHDRNTYARNDRSPPVRTGTTGAATAVG